MFVGFGRAVCCQSVQGSVGGVIVWVPFPTDAFFSEPLVGWEHWGKAAWVAPAIPGPLTLCPPQGSRFSSAPENLHFYNFSGGASGTTPGKQQTLEQPEGSFQSKNCLAFLLCSKLSHSVEAKSSWESARPTHLGDCLPPSLFLCPLNPPSKSPPWVFVLLPLLP